MARDELSARTSDAITLRLDRVHAAGDRTGVVLCLHAMMTDGRYFGARRPHSFASALADAGYEVYVGDFRGHGRSTPPRAGADDWSFDDLVERDLPAMIECVTASAACAASDLVVLGHSLGGLAVTAALGTGTLAALRAVVLPATTVWLVGPEGSMRRRALMAAYRGVTALFGKAPIRAIGAGTADESATFVGQLTGWARSARWTSMRGVDYLAALGTISTPVFPIVGAGDWMCSIKDATTFAERIPAAAPIRIVGKRFGDPIDPDHFQLFTRPELRSVWTELIATLP